MRQLARLALPVLSLPLSMVSCGDGLGGLLISNARELELGAQLDAQLRLEYPIATPEDPASRWLSQFVGRLAEAARPFRPPEEFGQFKVAIIADDALVNAFAGPGGFTYLSTGLILQASSCAELAGVMGHELAHVTERHSVKSIEDQLAVAGLLDLFLGDSNSVEVVSTIYGFFSATTFSQEHETEADVVGVQVSHDAGYNPFGLGDFFERLLALEGETIDLSFLSSHPANDARIARIASEIANRYAGAVVEGQTQSYDCLGTDLSFEQLKAHITSGSVAITPGTGVGLPADGANAAQPEAGDAGSAGETP